MGVYSKNVAAVTLGRTVAFGEKYAGRVSGDFVSRFAGVAQEEAKVARVQERIDLLRAKGQSTVDAEKSMAKAEASLARAQAETTAATDILEGRTVLGEGRSVRGIPRSDVEGVQTPEFAVTGGGRPDAIVEVKRLGNEAGKIGKEAVKQNFRKAASQISTQAAAKGETGALVRLDAGRGTIAQTNDEILNQVKGQWMDSLRENPSRAKDVGWVEVLDVGPGGEARRLLLKVERNTVTIDAGGTTRP
jgi:hypothetical protein